MSLLAPLYIAGILGVALPIVFHLIRRTPRHRQTFSSLMFLTPSPPRLSRRSRLTNILLLLLRAAVLTLLAIAFARPFFYRNADVNISTAQGKRIALLVDTSASMRRGDLWSQAIKQVDQALADLSPGDEAALFLFDRTVHPAFTFDQWNQSEISNRASLLRARLAEAKPTWSSTNLGEALAAVADQLAESHDAQHTSDIARKQITLISDLQQGAHVEALQGREWPEGVLLDVKPLSLSKTTNANLQLIKTDSLDPHPEQLRIRITNQPGSATDQFAINWANASGPLAAGAPQKIYVSPGRSQVIRVAWPPPDQHADRLILRGDDFDFDNTLYLAQARQQTVRVVYIGDDAADDPKGLSYYLRSTLIDTPQQKMDFAPRHGTEFNEPDLTNAGLVVISASVPDDRASFLRHFAETGGTILWVLKDRSTANALAHLGQIDSLTVDESPEDNYALLARLEETNPLLSTFADPRFADFSKIHFWKHRVVQFPAAYAIASFDNGDPFLIEKSIARGRLLIATAGWHPVDSQLALSTKFVPLIGGLVQHQGTDIGGSQFTVGDMLPGNILADHPGIYQVADIGGTPVPRAVNLASDESRTAPLVAADLAQWGAKVGLLPPSEVLVARQRQLKLFELENKQKMWRWLLVAALVLVAAETLLAGRLAHRASQPALETALDEQVTA